MSETVCSTPLRAGPRCPNAAPGPVHPRRSAATLLELLVAVAVISLLAAVLLPALGQAREAGRAAYCVATLHNAGLAATLYLDDNDGAFWPYYVDIAGDGRGRRNS